MHEKEEILLRVEHLCQYFKMGKSELKAVDDVSFDIKKGEVFGLVGESGCGKTTTGRSIIQVLEGVLIKLRSIRRRKSMKRRLPQRKNLRKPN